MHRIVILITLFLTAALFAAAGADDAIQVNVSPMKSTTRSYDPHHPPALMPATLPDEAGVTVSEFKCVVELEGALLHYTRRDKETIAEVRVKSAHIKLALTVSEWIADPSDPKIRRHEDGHRLIASHFYDHADQAAAGIVHQLIGTSVFGVGIDNDDAAKNALNVASSRVVRDYMIEVRDKSARVQQAYDEITGHGENSIDELNAIEQALARELKPATREAERKSEIRN